MGEGGTGSAADASDRPVGRRGALRALAAGGLTLGAGKAVDNVLVGYGLVTGTNLVDQDLPGLVGARLGPSSFATTFGDVTIGYESDRVWIQADGRVEWLPLVAASRRRAAELDDEFGLDGRFADLASDLVAIERGEYRFEFSTLPAFLDRIEDGDETARPETVGALRGARFAPADPAVVRAFADVDPADVRGLVGGLAAGFRTHANYDYRRYAAGAVEDNLLLGAGDLREPFRSPTSFEAILAGENTGLFCYDFTYRSVEALHATPPRGQTAPVAGAVVTDARHKHVYTGVATVVRSDGDLVVPMTFADYMHVTQYDDLHLRGVLGDGLDAYDDRHRTTDVFWNRYARW